MDNEKNDKYYAIRATKDIEAIQKYLGNRTYDGFLEDDVLLDAIMFRLIQLVENVKSLSSESKKENPDIPWHEIVGFRNGIVHEYGKTDYTIVYETITNDLPWLMTALEKISANL